MIPEGFIALNTPVVLQVILLGFIGGILSGFIGSGGAFFMTPGMMNLGIAGAVAVGTNTAHKFGKALMGARAHKEMGHVDRRLAWCTLVTAAIGNGLAVWINVVVLGGEKKGGGSAADDLYVSLIFVLVLSIVAVAMLRDALRHRESGEGPSTKLAEFFGRIRIPPVIHFRVADVKVSAWVIGVVGLATGFLAGTIGVGGFVGVPAMIYVFGIPSVVAAGTELYLAMFMGAWLAINYAWYGAVDIRMVMLLYLGSLTGIYIGAYGTRVVKEKIIRVVTGVIIILCVLSRAIAIPMYLRQLGLVNLPPELDVYFNQVSKAMLFASGSFGVAIILYFVIRAYVRRMRIEATLHGARSAPAR
jgi:uncharacterized membrane protein YfcA